MTKEFEAKTEAEAIENAVKSLGLERDDFDVEVINTQKKGLFKKGSVTIRVHVKDEDEDVGSDSEYVSTGKKLEPENENERKILSFIKTMVEKMGYDCECSINFRKGSKIGVSVESDSSSIIIGRKGKNLDAIQLLANVYADNLDEGYKVIVDSENYRMRHEEIIVRSAFKSADFVKRTGKSKLLEPMNPFERRLVHTALNDYDGVETKSEGEGLYKQVRIIPVK